MSESRKRQLSRRAAGKGMSLPFQPLNLAFRHMYYSVDMPSVSPGHLKMLCSVLTADLRFWSSDFHLEGCLCHSSQPLTLLVQPDYWQI